MNNMLGCGFVFFLLVVSVPNMVGRAMPRCSSEAMAETFARLGTVLPVLGPCTPAGDTALLADADGISPVCVCSSSDEWGGM
jgi:hypothetical protein